MKLAKMSLFTLVLLSLCVGCACNKQQESVPPPQGNPDHINLKTGDRVNMLGFDLFKKADAPGKNLFFSPYSISTAMAMAYAGAKGNTAKEMETALYYIQPQDAQHNAYNDLRLQLNAVGERKKAELSVANALFGAKRHEKLLLPAYLDILRNKYGSDLFSLDFGDAQGTADFINHWVEDKTNSRIKDLVSKDHIESSNDGLVLVNAIYFLGLWQKQFDPKFTRSAPFYLSAKERSQENSKPVQMMYQTNEFPYAETEVFQAIELPYEEQDLAMLVVIPEKMDGIGNYLNPGMLQGWQKALEKQKVNVYLPRFKFDLTLEGLTEHLKALGIKDAFSDVAADFSGIRDPRGGAGLYILDVIHKAFVEVKEEGTEAAAATAVVMATKSVDMTPTFRADVPFLYMIIHKPTNTILFMGKYAVPPDA